MLQWHTEGVYFLPSLRHCNIYVYIFIIVVTNNNQLVVGLVERLNSLSGTAGVIFITLLNRLSFRAQTHQDDIQEVAAMKTVASPHICLVQKAALEHTAETAVFASHQPQSVAANQKRQPEDCRYTNHCYDKAAVFMLTQALLIKIFLKKNCKWPWRICTWLWLKSWLQQRQAHRAFLSFSKFLFKY